MAGLLGKKIGMTQVFAGDGRVVPVTVVRAGPGSILEVLAEKKALRVGFEEVKEVRLKKPQRGYFKKLGAPFKRFVREIRFDEVSAFQPGQELTVSLFHPGDRVDVTGVTKGKGFTGMVKRFGASRWPMTHGHGEHRRTGSIGSSAFPGRVVRGKRMPGRSGGRKRTVESIKVVEVLEKENLLLLQGALPGAPGGLLMVRTARKKAREPVRETKAAPKPGAPKAKKKGGEKESKEKTAPKPAEEKKKQN